MSAIHQFVAGFNRGDAISNEALVLRDLFRAWGRESDIFCEQRRILPELRGLARDISDARSAVRPDDIVLLHLSIGSVVNDVFAELKCRKAILYHNITPAEYFRGVQEQIARLLALGREQAKKLANAAAVVMADSAFNAQELESWGYPRVQILPLVLDLNWTDGKPDRAVSRKFDRTLVNVLFVGRCVPNKKLEDALAAFQYFQRSVEPFSRFIHVGSFAGVERYHAILQSSIRRMNLENVCLVGGARQEELLAYYRSASVFLCMSEHEGFCIPIIEAMATDVPVLAFAAGAVPETMDGTGVLFREKRFELVAEMMGRLAHDAAFREAVLRGQRERIARYKSRDLGNELKRHLAPLL